jgi:Protein of unknown function (DUF2505)
MKLSGNFPCDFPPDTYQKYLIDEGTLAYLKENHPEIRDLEVLENRPQDDKVYIKLKYTMEVSMPGPVKKALGGASHSFVADLILDTQNQTATIEFNPARLADKIKAGARVTFERQGDRWVQRLDGDVTVKIFGLGKVVERFIVEKFQHSYATEARLRNDYMGRTEKGKRSTSR